ncbi:MAG: hypothetical protein FWG62_06475 [Proteobacteria bacterium]|nr:hypothetical protein [Pseudomonadota bacterium]
MLHGGEYMVTNIGQNQVSGTLLAYQKNSLELSRSSVSANDKGQIGVTDTINLRSESISAATYTGDLRLAGDDDARFNMLRSLVANLLQQQGIKTAIATGERTIDLNSITAKEAQDLISEDGYFGVEKTSERIFQSAVGSAGGDPAHIDAIKEGIEKGFAEAKKAFGGWLPDISYATYDAVMRKLDQWVGQQTTAA